MKLDGKAILVIGGASGLGRASAQACAAYGAQVVVADIHGDPADEVAREIRADGGAAIACRVDITDERSVEAAVDRTVTEFGRIDGLVTSAGASEGMAGPDGFERSLDMFLRGPLFASRHALKHMVTQGGGSIVHVASIAGVTGSVAQNVEQTGYAASKHGVIGLTRTLALAYAKQNVRVNAICPGYFKTHMNRSIHEDDGGLRHIVENVRVPMQRWGDPRELGEVAAFLMSDGAGYITGQPIIVDGGVMAR